MSAIKHETIQHLLDEIFELLDERNKCKKRYDELNSILKPHLEFLKEYMEDVDVEFFENNDLQVTRVKPYTYKKTKSLKKILQKDPDFIRNHPELIEEQTVSGHIKIKFED